MKKYLFYLMLPALLLMSVNVHAQDGLNPKDDGSKYGKSSEDSLECVQNISLFREYMKQDNIPDAIKPWRHVISMCPRSTLHMYVDGVKIMEYLMEQNKDDKETWNKYLDTLMMIYDQRIKFFGEEGYVLGQKGIDYLKHKKDPQASYETLKKSIEMEGKESKAAALQVYFQSATILYGAKKLEMDKVMEAYEQIGTIVIEHTGNKYYDRVKEVVDKLFEQIANCPELTQMYDTKFPEKSEDLDWLEKGVDLLTKKGCTDDEVYLKMAEKLHEKKPSAISAKGLGKKYSDQNEHSKALRYYKQAAELSESNEDKAEATYNIGREYYSLGQYANARSYAAKAAQLDPGLCKAYILIGDAIIAGSGSCDLEDFHKKALYWLAADYYQKAINTDASCAGDGKSRINQYKAYFPTKQEVFFQTLSEGDIVEIGCWINESTKVRFSD